jgi:plasmid stabilization system protein ParE
MHERRIRWTETARSDLDIVADYIAEDSVENALAVLDRLEQRADALCLTAERGRLVPELKAVDVLQYRELIERPGRIIYRIEPDQVVVLAVLDGRRDLRSLLLERLVRD